MGNEAFNVSGNLLQRLWSKVKNLENGITSGSIGPYSTLCFRLDETAGTITPTLLFDTSNGQHVVTFTTLISDRYYIQVTNANSISVMVSSCQDVATQNPYNASAVVTISGSDVELFVQDATGVSAQNWTRLNLWLFIN